MSWYTKGPWSIDAGHMITNSNSARVAYADLMSKDDEALVLASPDLLEAAKAVCEAWSNFIDSFDYVPGIGDRAEDIEFQEMMRLRMAINKATTIQ